MKQIWIILIFLNTFAISTSIVQASDFATDAKVSYDVDTGGETKVTYDIQIENTSEAALSKGYILSVTHVSPRDIIATEDGKSTEYEIAANDIGTNIILHFQKPVNGVGKKKKVTVSFTSQDIARESGEIWEIFVPKLAHEDDFRTFDLTLSIPLEFGDEGYINPSFEKRVIENEKRTYSFQKKHVNQSGITAVFGKFQVYAFDLTYHLTNDSWKSKIEEIAIPPDTSTQKIYLEKIEPEPNGVEIDDDGNWIASHSVLPFSQKTVHVEGKAQIFASSRRLFQSELPELDAYKKSTRFWPTADPRIQKLASDLRTPKAIYNYVVDTLAYDYGKTSSSTKREGAIFALENPTKAICTEFTDLYITLARAAGIPAREINGAALSNNPKVQPLSLVADVLHSWVEYYDSERQMWVPIDPTWGKTTGGVDYFSTFDLKHVVFVIHGKNDSQPKPAGSYKNERDNEKDVYVALSKLPEKDSDNTDISYEKSSILPFTEKWNITLLNKGMTALYNQTIDVYSNDIFSRSISLGAIPPFGQRSFSYETPVGIFGRNLPRSVTLHTSSKTIQLPVSGIKTAFKQIMWLSIPLAIVLGGIYLFSKWRRSH